VSTPRNTPLLFDETAISEGGDRYGRTVINGTLSFVERAGVRVVFRWHEPLYRFALSDTLTMRFVAVHLRIGELATQEEVSQSFGHSVATQRRWEKRFQEQGLQGLEKKKSSGRPPNVPETFDSVLRKWFEQGISNTEMARRLVVSNSAIHRALARIGLRRRSAASPELPWPDDDDDDTETPSAEQLPEEALQLDEQEGKETTDSKETIEAASSRTDPKTGDEVCCRSSSNEEGLTAGASLKVVKSLKPVDEFGDHEATAAKRPGNSETQWVESEEGVEITVESESDDPPGVVRREGLSDSLAKFAEEGFTIDRDPDYRGGDRGLACLGQLDDAVPLFGDRPCLRQAGVLLAIPLLVNSGLLDVFSKVYHSLGPAFYGLRTTVVVLFVSALLRIKRPEHFKEYNPRELGHVVGLDRAPEVKTVRRKVTELAARKLARELMQEAAQHRIDEAPDRVAFLYVDGHVREYHGGYPLANLCGRTRARISWWVSPGEGEEVTKPSRQTWSDRQLGPRRLWRAVACGY